jgi:hypothetical protein
VSSPARKSQRRGCFPGFMLVARSRGVPGAARSSCFEISPNGAASANCRPVQENCFVPFWTSPSCGNGTAGKAFVWPRILRQTR